MCCATGRRRAGTVQACRHPRASVGRESGPRPEASRASSGQHPPPERPQTRPPSTPARPRFTSGRRSRRRGGRAAAGRVGSPSYTSCPAGSRRGPEGRGGGRQRRRGRRARSAQAPGVDRRSTGGFPRAEVPRGRPSLGA